MHTKLIAAGFTMYAGLAIADGTADWKVYAFSGIKPQVALFYLNSEIVFTPGHVQVWIKALDEKKLEASHLDGKGEVIETSVKLIAKHYVPPLGSVTKLTVEQSMQLTLFEQIADEGSITPTLRALYEIDCGQKMARTLSIVGPKPGPSDNRVREWEHVPPESTLEMLSKLTCRPT